MSYKLSERKTIRKGRRGEAWKRKAESMRNRPVGEIRIPMGCKMFVPGADHMSPAVRNFGKKMRGHWTSKGKDASRKASKSVAESRRPWRSWTGTKQTSEPMSLHGVIVEFGREYAEAALVAGKKTKLATGSESGAIIPDRFPG
jgi:hypothetical protein